MWKVDPNAAIFQKVDPNAAIFQALHGFLSGERSRSDECDYANVGRSIGMTAAAVQVAVHRLRRRYGLLLQLLALV